MLYLPFFCFFLIISAVVSQTSEVAETVPPFLVIYKNGTVVRLVGNQTVPPSLDTRTGVQSKDVLIDPKTGVSGRLYKPNITNPHSKIPLLVYFHGGGFLIETSSSPKYHYFLNTLVSKANVIAVSVNYRRAPEHPLPIAYSDSWAALEWVAMVSQSIDFSAEPWLKGYVDFNRVFLAGDSAGANIGHNIGLRLGSEKLDGIKIRGIVMLHPYFWGKNPVGAEIANPGLRAMINKWWTVASPSASGLDNPLINPLKDPRLSRFGCHKILIFVAGDDVFKYRGIYYYGAMKRSGWFGFLKILETRGEGHVFFLDFPNSEKTFALVNHVVFFIRHA